MAEVDEPSEIVIFSIPIATTKAYRDFFFNELTYEARNAICEMFSSKIVEMTLEVLGPPK
jgi:hypothetical protein